MACFVTPMAAAVATTLLMKKLPARIHPRRLALMLWSCVAALLVDHALNGELSVYPPFLTALKDPAAIDVVLREIALTGGLMTAVVIALWGATLLAGRRAEMVSRRGFPAS